MFPTSSRVKLNRAALTAKELTLVPRRRRVPTSLNNATADSRQQEEKLLFSEATHTVTAPSSSEPVRRLLTGQTGPENVTDTVADTFGGDPEKFVGAQTAKRRIIVQSCKGNNSQVFTPEGPVTRGKYLQSSLNTRTKCRLAFVRKLCNLRLRFIWCFCTDSDSVRALLKQSEAHRRVKPRDKTSETSCQIKLNNQTLSSKSHKNQKPFKCHLGKLSGVIKPSVRHKSRGCHVSESGRDSGREGEGRAETMAAGGGHQPAAAAAAANTGGAPRGQPTTTLSNFDRNTPLSPTGPAGSEGSLRRPVKASSSGLCGDCKFVSPQLKRQGEQGQNSTSQGPEQSTVEVKIKKESTVTETSQKIIISIGQYPKVTLCDIAQKLDAITHNCGYILPDILKTKDVHCFKQEMRAAFRFGSGCLLPNRPKNEESREFCPKVQSEKSTCQSQSMTEHQSYLKGCTDAQTLPSHTTSRFLKSWTSEGSATYSASFSLGKCAKKQECGPGMWDRDDWENPGPGIHLMGADIHTDKKIQPGENIKNEIFVSTPDLERINYKQQIETESRDKQKIYFLTSDGSLSRSKHAVGSNGTYDSEQNCGEINSPAKTEAAEVLSELSCERNGVDADELETFTCQRVRVHFRKNQFSCARTYMSWPFCNNELTLKRNVSTTACPAEPVDPPDNCPCSQTDDILPNGLDSSSEPTHQVSSQNEEKQEKDRDSFLAQRNKERHGNMSTCFSDDTNVEFAPHLLEAEESRASLSSDTTNISSPSQHEEKPGTHTAAASCLPVNRPQTDSSTSTVSPSALGLSDWETATTLSSMSSPFTQGGLSSLSAMPSSLSPSSFFLSKVKTVELADFSSPGVVEKMLYCEETTLSSCSSSSSTPSHNSDSIHSCDSSLLLPQDEQERDEGQSPPRLEPYYNTSPVNHHLLQENAFPTDKCGEAEFMLPPMLSPVMSPHGYSQTNFLPHCPSCPDEEEEEMNEGTCKHRMSPGCHMAQTVCTTSENAKDFPDHINELEGVVTNFNPLTPLREPQSSPSNNEDMDDDDKEENQDETDCENNVKQGNEKFQQVLPDPKVKATLTSGVLTEPCSSPSSDEENGGVSSDEEQQHSSGDKRLSLSETAGNERHQTKADTEDATQQGILDEFTAYEQDILLVDVIQDDSELFENLPQKSLLKLGPTRLTEAPKNRTIAVVKTLPRTNVASPQFEQRLTRVNIDFLCDSPDITEENTRPWRPQRSRTPSKVQSSTWSSTEKQTEKMGRCDANNNRESEGLERSQPIQTVNSLHNHIPPLLNLRNGPWTTNAANTSDFRRQKSNAYCRQYFSESLTCGFKMCRFQHVPLEGDEKFCIETVCRFTKNPMCLQKAGAVFTSYYQNNPPGVYFSMPVLLALLWALLKASMVSDVLSVLTVSVAHKIVPGPDFLLALCNLVREKGLVGLVPELMQLTFKMASAGLVLSKDCLDCVKNNPEVQQTVSPNSMSGNHNAPVPEHLNLAHAIVEIELCTKQEDWRQMAEVLKSYCHSSQRLNHMEQISGRIAIALLSESKDKLSLPFAAFAETVCQNKHDDGLVGSFLGRIGVSLMLRYHKTHQWAKGKRVVEVLSISKVNYTTLKGLFGNEDGASRCCLVTVAAELFLLSGSVEGALNTLRENKWFLSSSLWPCEPSDLESRSRVLMRLAEKTSHRDTLDVLCNLPGLKEPNDLIDSSRYCPLFNAHLQVCVDRQKLTVASDTVDFMLSNNLAVDNAMLQILLHKLGKQKLWLRAREIFRDSLREGYYPHVSAPSGCKALIVPCELGEVELALTFEMFITVNAAVLLHLSEMTTCCLSITLKRTQSCESDYLSASSRLLSAASILEPKLLITYTAVNSSQEQVFTLDISSARSWLYRNHSWANEVWAH